MLRLKSETLKPAQYIKRQIRPQAITLCRNCPGTYELSVTLPGFKKYVRQNIGLGMAQTLRVDVGLEVGATTDSVTVTEAVRHRP